MNFGLKIYILVVKNRQLGDSKKKNGILVCVVRRLVSFKIARSRFGRDVTTSFSQPREKCRRVVRTSDSYCAQNICGSSVKITNNLSINRQLLNFNYGVFDGLQR